MTPPGRFVILCGSTDEREVMDSDLRWAFVMDLPRLIESLSAPAAYPFRVDKIEIRQTHISVVFLAGPFAYKIKKPVNLGFLDFTTLDKRLHFCEEEVRLNRRLAPEVYLGVVPVVHTRNGIQFEGEGQVIEWAVKMQRLPETATLRERLLRGEISAELVEALARKIAGFHQAAEGSQQISAFGHFEGVARIVLDVFAQATPQVGTTVSRAVFDRLLTLAKNHLDQLRPLIESRAARGMTRDMHGDLHLDHVYFFPDKEPPADLVIIDCIEFNQRFRFIDPVADMAFPAMDFAFCGRRDLAHVFAEAYFRASGDEEGKALLPLYTAYRATVRGMVEGLKLAEKEVPAGERTAALASSQAHWLLALTELEEPGRKPCLLLVAGLPGTGKSTLSRGLAERAGFYEIRSDVVRKRLVGPSSSSQTPSRYREGLYTTEWNERTYSECLRTAEELLFDGKRVVVDATFREENRRRSFLDAAIRWGVPAVLLLCRAKSETVQGRLKDRHGDASDADWSIYLDMAAHWEETGPLTRRSLHEVHTDGSKEQALARALEVLRQLGLQG